MDFQPHSKASRLATLSKVIKFILRLATTSVTIAAALLMGFNNQTRNVEVAIVGTTPLYRTITAKFYHTPAFVYFVIVNGTASMYNLTVLFLGLFLSKCKGFEIIVQVMDLAVMGLLASGAAAATSMAELGKKGDMHARWSPICDRFHEYCHRTGLSLIAAYVGVSFFVLLNAHSIIALRMNARN